MTFQFIHSFLDEKPIEVPVIGLSLRVPPPPGISDGAVSVIEMVNAPGLGIGNPTARSTARQPGSGRNVASEEGALQGRSGAGRAARGEGRPPVGRALSRALERLAEGTVATGAGGVASTAQPGDGRQLPLQLLVEDVLGMRLARASQSGTAATCGSSQAGGPRAGAIRGGSDGSPRWVRMLLTHFVAGAKATRRRSTPRPSAVAVRRTNCQGCGERPLSV
jgi:hypothetical protein